MTAAAGLSLSNLLSAAVIAAIVTGVVSYFNNRRNARVAERRNVQDEDNDIVTRYKDAAAEERSQKESAVKTVRELLAIAEQQIQILRTTIEQLTSTIGQLQKSAESQQQLIETVTAERDALAVKADELERELDVKRTELLRKQHEILEISYPRAVVDRMFKEAPKE